ncbi:multiple epidermal growth factor-like domains protein 10 isoform X2 [Magallana gigas]|uniref:multiple epidermal growth factor-like domains protein 10 isoform X2 n=1 Tax=Magallana gigas TaxID=29159 RepID=UPI0033418514
MHRNITWVYEYCCSGYEEKDNKCIECSPGFLGLNCSSSCPKNSYGKKCEFDCHCDKETHYCHHICGCLPKLIIVSNATVTNDSTSSVRVTSSFSADTCLSTAGLASTRHAEQASDQSQSGTGTTRGNNPHQSHFHLLFGTSCAVVVCIFFLVALLYWLRIRTVRKKEEDANGAAHNQINDGQSEEPLYDSNEEACYSILTLRVNNSNESHKETSSSKEPFFASDNPYGFAYDYSRNNYDS